MKAGCDSRARILHEAKLALQSGPMVFMVSTTK